MRDSQYEVICQTSFGFQNCLEIHIFHQARLELTPAANPNSLVEFQRLIDTAATSVRSPIAILMQTPIASWNEASSPLS